MKNKTGIIALVISVVAIVLSIVNLVPSAGSTDVQYVMYIGTNDKDTDEPVCTPEEAKKLVEYVLLGHFGGYTIQEADGSWEDSGTLYQEYSIVAILSDTNLDAVHKAADELCDRLNQAAILIQTNKTTTEFYEGK